MPGPRTADLLAELADMLPPSAPLSDAVRARYLRALGEFSPDVQRCVVDVLIDTCRYWPRVSEVREAAAECVLALPTEAQALAQIEARVAWARNGAGGDPPPVHPIVRRVADLVGGFPAFRASEDPHVVRGQFGRLYREERAATVRAVQTGKTAAL